MKKNIELIIGETYYYNLGKVQKCKLEKILDEDFSKDVKRIYVINLPIPKNGIADRHKLYSDEIKYSREEAKYDTSK